MPNYGVIDLGSNSVRLVVYEVKDDRRAVYTNKDFRSLLNDKVMADVEAAPYGEHPSNLGAYLARKLGDMVGIPAFFVDPVCVDEMTEVAHYTGFAEFRRLCQFHALNHKAVGRKAAEKLGKKYEDVNLIVCHRRGGRRYA